LIAQRSTPGAGYRAAPGSKTPATGPAITARGAQPDHELAGTLGPRTAVLWSIESASDQPGQVMTGKSYVGPDGTLELGPYGTVQVTGLSLDQAQAAVEKHVGKYITQAHVRILLPGMEVTARRETAAPPVLQTAGNAPAAPEPSLAAGSDESEKSPGPIRTAAESKPPADQARNATLASNWHPIRRKDEPARTVVRATVKKDKEPPNELLHPPKKMPRSAEEPPIADSTFIHPTGIYAGNGAAPHEMAKVSLPAYVIEPPDILLIEAEVPKLFQRIGGQHLVRLDGTVGLGTYGSVQVAGMTLEQARAAIAEQVRARIKDFDADKNNLVVDVLAYNSKFYYIVTDGGGYGEQVVRVPITGSETVLDAISQINGLPAVASKKHIWIARRTGSNGGQVLPVDWNALVQGGSTATNYQMFPGDRLYVRADKWVRFGNAVDKRVWPFERLLGATLLGSETVNSIQGRGSFGSR